MVQKSAAEWVSRRAEAGRIEHQWSAERTILESTVKGLGERARLLEEKRDLLRAKTAAEREERAVLDRKVQANRAELAVLEERIRGVNESLFNLRPNLPPRLSAALEMSFRSLEDPELPLNDRLQLVTTVLNRCVQFNHLISCGQEVLTLDAHDGAKSLPVIYWGLSHGYALDEPAGKAWLGAPGANGWTWEPRPDSASAIAKLIAIYHDQVDPEFVVAPASLRQLTAQNANP